MSEHVPWSLEEVGLKKALLGLFTFDFLYASSHPETYEAVNTTGTGFKFWWIHVMWCYERGKSVTGWLLVLQRELGAHLWEWIGVSRVRGGPVWTIKWPEQLIRPWQSLNRKSDFAVWNKLLMTQTGSSVNYLWISCHDGVVAIVVIGRGLDM